MTKTCPHGRDGSLALLMLEESLRRLQTDRLDLWQVHGMAFDNDAELFIRKNGAPKLWKKPRKMARCVSLDLPAIRIPKFTWPC